MVDVDVDEAGVACEGSSVNVSPLSVGEELESSGTGITRRKSCFIRKQMGRGTEDDMISNTAELCIYFFSFLRCVLASL